MIEDVLNSFLATKISQSSTLPNKPVSISMVFRWPQIVVSIIAYLVTSLLVIELVYLTVSAKNGGTQT